MAAVAADEHIGRRGRGTREDPVVGGIAGQAFRLVRRWWPLGRYPLEEAARLVPSLVGEAELALEHALELDHDRLGDDEDDPAVDRVLDQPAGRAVGDQRGDEDVRIAADAQGQPRSLRISSTSASTSSGPCQRGRRHHANSEAARASTRPPEAKAPAHGRASA